MNQFKFTVTVGDIGGDGHDSTETFMINSNQSKDDVVAAYFRMSGQFPLFDTWFEYYEDYQISVDDYEALIALDQTFGDFFERTETRKMSGVIVKYSLEDGPTGYTKLWIALLTHFTPELELSIVPDDRANIDLGGYGLLGN